MHIGLFCICVSSRLRFSDASIWECILVPGVALHVVSVAATFTPSVIFAEAAAIVVALLFDNSAATVDTGVPSTAVSQPGAATAIVDAASS